MQPDAPSPPTARAVCHEVVAAWREAHGLTGLFEEETARAVARCNTWISPLSVAAGVMDLFSASHPESRVSVALIRDLGDRLGMRLREEGLLLAQPRRTASLSDA